MYNRREVRQPASGLWDQLELPEHLVSRDHNGPLLHDPFANIHDMTAKLNKATTNDVEASQPRAMWKLKLRLYLAFPLYCAKLYLLRGYWRVGMYGLIAAIAGAHSRWIRDAKYYEKRMLSKVGNVPEMEFNTSQYAAWRLNSSAGESTENPSPTHNATAADTDSQRDENAAVLHPG